MDKEHVYGYRAVAFLDVLGFSDKLDEFEAEVSDRFVSKKASEFIGVFKSAIESLDPKRYACYLFSDNICITTISDDIADLRDLLIVVCELFYRFAKKGYFLRGGIYYGLFINEEFIAIGVPLKNAYKMENQAIYPRVVMSERFIEEFQGYNEGGEIVFDEFYDKYFILNNYEVNYLNVFLYVFQTNNRKDKEGFFIDYNTSISNCIKKSKIESVFIKYKWLADQFNIFIDLYVDSLVFLDNDFDPESEHGFLDFVIKKRINYHV